jgi:putative transposase
MLMQLIDEEYTLHPASGSRQMTDYLKGLGYPVNRKRVQRLMHQMGLTAVYPKPRLSRSVEESRKYPYLLRGAVITGCNQVWGVDITYIRLVGGFLYCVALMDWYSRYILSWGLSNSLDVLFCLEAAEKALEKGIPQIMNSDQGSQFTCGQFVDLFEKRGSQISWDGKGRALDNVFVERFWRTLKYEEVYLREYGNGGEAHRGIANYIEYYNTKRHHSSLEHKTPYEVYYGKHQLGKALAVRSR